ncbi:hypothetical protein AZI87_08415 [Bdellovibrio bacteriovorus]|uniref:histidine kinase n=1 Tax=Bdellovibrio bacteriovorus TaxID=959 RepID=A0A162GYB9_BDEBC|nr:PAS domain-containing protein [Bdellovibrio bacteriovorus]KYG69221.1 hypothetical protein AZI87_08415 [Bdellovibrio bacteriovorus]
MKTINFDQSNATLLIQVFQNSPSFMAFVEGAHFIFKFGNPKFLELIGHNEIIGKTAKEALPELEEQGLLDIMHTVSQTKTPYKGFEVPVYFKSPLGRLDKFLDFTYQPILSDHGNVVGILIEGTDVTEKVLSRIAVEKAKSIVENERNNFRSLFKDTPHLVCILRGPEHTFEFVNEAHARLLGFDATGMTVRQAQPESIEVHGLLDDVYRTGVTLQHFEIPVTVGDRIRYFNLTYSARRDDDGHINGVMILASEVTTHIEMRKELEASKQTLALEQHKLDAIFHVSPAAMALWVGEDMVFEKLNNEYQKIFSGRDLQGRPFLEALPELEQFGELVRKVLRTGEPFVGTEFPVPVRRTEFGPTEERYFDFTYIQIKDAHGNPYGVYDHAIDVTDRVMARKDLEAAKEEAVRANDLKSAFLANMSHEIRTPLGAIMGFADLLRDPNLPYEERVNYLEVLQRNGHQLTVIINDILDLSKVEAGQMALEFLPLKPETIAHDVISLLRVNAAEKGLQLGFERDPSTPAEIHSDPTRVQQILINLVSNSIKFTHTGSVSIRTFGKTEKGRTVAAFEVIDTGIGIQEDQRERIFEVFVQADSSVTRKFGGTGLGLSLSRRLARVLGGDVIVKESLLGKGSTFLVTIEDQPEKKKAVLPVVAASSAAEAKENSEKPLEGIKVLVVDDTPDNQRLIKHFLRRAGASSDIVDNGLVAQTKALEGDYDIVLMDIQMPEMDGYTATQQLRQKGYKKPIIALTAHAMAEVRRKCLSVGYTDHLTKPINSVDLISMVHRYVRA